MPDSLASWERKYYAKCNSEAMLFYVAFGDIAQGQPLNRRKYRCGGIPVGFQVMACDKVRNGDYINRFLQGYPWDQLLVENAGLAHVVEQAPGCVVVHGSQKNPKTLAYLRDCIGLLTFFLDNGASAVFDPQTFHWYSSEEWREQIFAPAALEPHRHVVILHSEEEHAPDLLWFHTRGMRKFGRPDVSVRRVGAHYRYAIIDLCNRFIEHQAFGAVIPEGQAVRMASLPPGGVVHHQGDFDDPDFNNVHVEITWPEPGLTAAKSD